MPTDTSHDGDGDPMDDDAVPELMNEDDDGVPFLDPISEAERQEIRAAVQAAEQAMRFTESVGSVVVLDSCPNPMHGHGGGGGSAAGASS
jgi:hypothetical protein